MVRRGSLVCGPALALLAGLGLRAAGEPKLVCREPVHDFGTRSCAETIRHVFALENEGTAPLSVERLRVCCGAAAELDRYRLPPGATAELTVSLSLLGRKGPQRKSIYVVLDDPRTPYYRLQLTGTATTRIEAVPDRIDFGEADEKAVVRREVLLRAASDTVFQVTRVSSSRPSFRVAYETLEPGRRYRLTAHTVPPLPSGLVRGRVKVETDLAGYPAMELSISARVDSELVVVPREIVVRPGADGKRYLALRRRGGAPFRILDVTVPDEALRVETTILGRHGYRLTLTGRCDPRALDGRFLSIRTDVEGMEEVDIPFRAAE